MFRKILMTTSPTRPPGRPCSPASVLIVYGLEILQLNLMRKDVFPAPDISPFSFFVALIQDVKGGERQTGRHGAADADDDLAHSTDLIALTCAAGCRGRRRGGRRRRH